MTAAAMESKRLGLCQKSLFVVPNHLTEQWASDFLRLYPGANILAATKKDFEPANRKKFCSRIATGDYDAVIIGHSQFEKIPLSQERQAATIERQIDEIELAIEQAKKDNGERYTIKQMEKSRKALQVRLDKLNDQSRKDNVVTFEQLGVDRLFVDESHNYKNLFLYTKMRNVAGIAQTEAQKSSDMFAKCQYLDEITGGKGVTFATGTPISNSMTELYTNMRYLQYGTLQKLGLGHFDAWAASFGETQTAIELAPEGTGYRAKTRFAKFFNLPELIALFKESADIQTPDMLKLPVPEAEYENVVLKPSEFQKEMVASLAERAEAVRDRQVQPYEDNNQFVTQGREVVQEQNALASEEKVHSELEKKPVIEPETVHITFTVAECGEFHNMGEYHEGIETIEEAMKLYNAIDPSRMQGIPSIGVNMHIEGTEEWEDEQADIASGKRIDVDFLNYTPELRDTPKVQDAIKKLIAAYPEKDVIDMETKEHKIQRLAAELDQLSYDIDTFEYRDSVPDREAQVQMIANDIRSGNVKPLQIFLQTSIDEGIDEDSERQAKELIAKLAEYKPLAKIEELEEQNYNMIDDRLNNGVEKFNREEEKKEQREKPQARSSLKERLAAKQKEVAQGNNKDTKELEKSKNSHREM